MAPPVPKSLGLNSSKSLIHSPGRNSNALLVSRWRPESQVPLWLQVSVDADHMDPCGSWDSVVTQWVLTSGWKLWMLASKHHLQSELVTDLHTGVHGGGGHFLLSFSILYEAGLGDFEEKNQLHLHITKNISQEKL